MHQIRRTISECIGKAGFVSIGPDERVTDAVAAMVDRGTDCVLVLEQSKLIGIFTERDYLHRVCAAGIDPQTTPLRDVMTANPVTLQPHDCVTFAINKMALESYRHMPIVDDDGHPTSLLDARLVMMHLVKVFAEVEAEPVSASDGEWIDIGGG